VKKILLKYPLLKYFLNRYVLISTVFVVWMLFLDNYSYLQHRELNKEIEELEENIEYYKAEIKKDSIQIKKLRNPAEIEKYAREKYYMKKTEEDIYIVDFKKDTVN
jgi:cell division protein DivIC